MITKQQAAKLKMLVSDVAETKSACVMQSSHSTFPTDAGLVEVQNDYAASLEAFDSFVNSITEE